MKTKSLLLEQANEMNYLEIVKHNLEQSCD